MVAPYNYLMGGGGSPIEAALGGLRIGASLAEMEAARAVQLANEQAKLEAVRQRDRNQQRFQQLINVGRPMTVAESAEAASLVNEQAGGIIRDSVKNLPEQQQFASAGRIGRLISAAQNAAQDKRYVPFFDSLMVQSIEAETDPAQKKALQDLQEFARISADPTKVANFGLAMMEAAGGKYSEIAKAIHERSKAPETFRVLTPDQAKADGLPPGNVYQRNTATGKTELLTAAGKTFEVLSADQVKELGLQPGAYKREIGTREVSAIGAGGTNIQISNIERTGQTELAQEARGAYNSMNSAASLAGDVPRYRRALQSAITGPFAEERLLVSRVFGYNPDQVAATRTVIQGLAKAALSGRQLLVTQGSISNFEQQMIDKAEGGDINWSRTELSALLDVAEKSARAQYEQGQRFLDGALAAYPDASSIKVFKNSVKPLPPPVARPPGAPRSVVEPPQQTGAVATPVPGGNVAPATTAPMAPLAPRGPETPMRILSPAGAAPPARGGTSLGDGFYLTE